MEHETATPWWAGSRDKFILWICAAMFGVLVWQIPAKIEAMREEHRHLLTVLQIQCVHDSKSAKEQRECLTLVLE